MGLVFLLMVLMMPVLIMLLCGAAVALCHAGAALCGHCTALLYGCCALHGAIILTLCASPSAAFLRLCIAVTPVLLRAGGKLSGGSHGPKGGLKRRPSKKVKLRGAGNRPKMRRLKNTPKNAPTGPSIFSPARERPWEQLFCCSRPDLGNR